jgi:hypothetical protein
VEQVTDAFEIITGFVIEEQERAQSAADRYDLAARDSVVGEDFPLAIASGHRTFRPAEDEFAEQLDLIVPALAGRSG